MLDTLYNLYRKVSRMCYWGWKLRNNYDFDGSYIYEVLYRKLARMQTQFLKRGHCEWCRADSPLMKRLATAKTLAKRLAYDEFTSYKCETGCLLHQKEEPKTLSQKLLAYCGNIRAKSSTSLEILAKRCPHGFKCVIRREEQRELEHTELFRLLNKYTRSWWD